MTARSSWRDLWRLVWPLVGAMFLQFAVGLTDVYVAGRFGAAAQAAVGFCATVLFFFNVVGHALGVGLVAVIARSEGAGSAAASAHASRQGVLLAVAAMAPLALAGVLASPGPRVLAFLPPEVASWTAILLPWYAAAALPQAVLVTAAALFRARRRPLWMLASAAVVTAVNVPGNFALAFGVGGLPALGPLGVAIATGGSLLAGAAFSLAGLARGGELRGTWRPDIELARRLARLAWPAALLQVGWHLGTLALYAILGRLEDGAVVGTAALTNGLRIEAVLYLPAFALNMAAGVLVGQALGGGSPTEATQAGWRVAGTGAAVLTALALPVFLWSRELAGLLTQDSAVGEATHLYLRFNMVSQPFMALSVCLGGGLQGAGDTRGTMAVVLGALWLLRIPLALLLALTTPLGASGVWAAMVASQVVQGLWMAARFRRGAWRGEEPREADAAACARPPGRG